MANTYQFVKDYIFLLPVFNNLLTTRRGFVKFL